MTGILAPHALRRVARVFLLLSLALVPSPGRAADTVSYDVTIAPSGEAPLDTALHDASTLISLHDSAPVDGFALLARARADADRFTAVLHSFGYYRGTASIRIAGHTLDDPALPDAIPTTGSVKVEVAPERGTLFHLRRIGLTGDAPSDAATALALSSGMPARAADVLAARERLLAALRNSGHALATVDAPVATLVPGDAALDVDFAVHAGPRVDLGEITITGQERLQPDYLGRRITLRPGEPYAPARLDTARQDLAESGAIAGVRIETPETLDAQGRLPVHIVVTERKPRAVSASAALSTDQGGSVSASWTHRDLFGHAEQLKFGAAITGLGGTAERQPGYDLTAQYTIPDWLRRNQSLTFQATGVQEFLQAYDRTAAIASVTVSRKLFHSLTASLGLAAEQAHFVQEEVGRDYTLMQLPLGLTWDDSNSLFDPSRGIRAAVTLTPSYSLSTGSNTGFMIAQASASTYLDIGGMLSRPAGRTVLAVRGLLGGVEGASVFDLPPDQRFYGGGGGTIRGYRFQSVGPSFPSGHPTGGTSIDVGTLELRQRFGDKWGVAAFLDAGQVGSTSLPFSGDFRAGAGLGARYYTSIGPLRLDVAVPLVHQQKSDLLEVYIGIGQAF